MGKIAALFFSVLLTCGTVRADGKQQNWIRTYGGGSDEILGYIVQTNDSGFISAGATDSFGTGEYDFLVIKTDGIGTVCWQMTFGLSSNDIPGSIVPTSDGGYIVVGRTNSLTADGGGYDVLTIKLSSAGGVSFNRTVGGSGDDVGTSIAEVFDENGKPDGYIFAGYTDSTVGGDTDIWIMKLTPVGFISWQQAYGGSGEESAYSIEQTADGGYIATGATTSFGAGGSDLLVLKLDAEGKVYWQKAYGGTKDDRGLSIKPAQDGGYVAAGHTSSFGSGGSDFWVLKLDAEGNVSWQKAYGGTKDDRALSIETMQDGGYVVAGETSSFGSGGSDALILKLNADGTVSLQQTFGGSGDECAYSAGQTSDGGCVVAGDTDSLGAGGSDLFVLRFDNEEGLLECSGVGSPAVAVSDTAAISHDGAVDVAEVDAASAATRWNPDNSSGEIFTVCPWKDSDDDGIPDGMPGDTPCAGGKTDTCADNCPDVANPDQEDSDEDGIGDACETTSLCPAERIFGEHGTATVRLRIFRDHVLSKTEAGRGIIQSYYSCAPAVMKVLECIEGFNKQLRRIIY